MYLKIISGGFNMKITIDEQSVQWYKEELELETGDCLRFFPRYGGYSPIQSGFSLGINKEAEKQAAVSEKRDGITYFINEEDVWYFDGHDLHITYNEQKAEPVFSYSK